MPAVTRFGDADVTHCTGMTRLDKSSNVFVNGIENKCKIKKYSICGENF